MIVSGKALRYAIVLERIVMSPILVSSIFVNEQDRKIHHPFPHGWIDFHRPFLLYATFRDACSVHRIRVSDTSFTARRKCDRKNNARSTSRTIGTLGYEQNNDRGR